MRRWILLTSLLCAVMSASAQEARKWTDRRGAQVEATFVKQDGPTVSLRLKDGRIVPAKLESLCDADQDYVKELTSGPKEIIATFKRDEFGRVSEESGTSPAATIRDLVSIKLVVETGEKKGEVSGDARWKIESVDALGNRIAPRKESGRDELVTEGKYVFVTYSVENDSNVPLTVPSPMLIDKRGRKFLQAAKDQARAYLPEKALLAEVDSIQPGFKKLFCAFYELPLEAEPAIVEIFASKTSHYAIEQFEAKGKQIFLSENAPAAGGDAKAASPNAAQGAGKKASVFLKCVRTGQGGDTSGYWLYDRNKKRSLSYGVELRLIGGEKQTVTVKTFFIGSLSSNKEVVVDQKEDSVVLEPGKIARVSLQSKEIEENTYLYYYGSRISGAKLKGVIVQVWDDGELVSNFVSVNQWKKYGESSDLVKLLGKLETTLQ